MLIDCEKCRFSLTTYYEEMERGLYDYQDFACMSSTFLAHHPYKIGRLDPHWNVLDCVDKNTYFNEAIAAGYITQKDIDLSLVRSYVRPDIMKGNSPSLLKLDYIKRYIGIAKKSVKKFYQPEPA